MKSIFIELYFVNFLFYFSPLFLICKKIYFQPFFPFCFLIWEPFISFSLHFPPFFLLLFTRFLFSSNKNKRTFNLTESFINFNNINSKTTFKQFINMKKKWMLRLRILKKKVIKRTSTVHQHIGLTPGTIQNFCALIILLCIQYQLIDLINPIATSPLSYFWKIHNSTQHYNEWIKDLLFMVIELLSRGEQTLP